MASGTTSSGKRSIPVIAGSGTSLEQEQFIEAQLLRTRRRVKLVDLGTVAMGLIGGILAFLLVFVVLDHWVVDLGWGGRVGALTLLVIALGYGAAGRLVPLIRRGINPVYAAKAIEQSDPSLKNSLINFLMFRRDASTTSRLVHQALRQRAASDLQQVNLDLAVDQTRVIRLGYAVAVLMVLFTAYTVFSPKDVFQTMRRMAAPWADIPRPTRVRITDIEPGDTSRVFGAHVTVSARIYGVRPEEPVRLLYTTDDSQTVNREILMTSPAPGQRYEGTLPADSAGLQQDVTYRIAAGDGQTAGFRVAVTATPSILVQRVEYEYPPYTRRERRVVEREGEISGLEGTRVTVRALTNHPIKTASIEFDPSTASSRGSGSAGRIQPMEFRGQEAWFTFTLQWDHEREVPVHSSYRLAFTTTDDLRSEDGMIYRILVSRDLRPEIAILTPKEDDIQLRLNASQKIEVRAIDPDFGLSRVVLRAVTGGRNPLEEPLLVDAEGRVGQVVLDYNFSPTRLGLSAGDRVTFWAFAEDNRSLPLENAFGEPNSERTRDYVITILPPDPAAPPTGADQTDQPSPDENTQPAADQPQPQPADGADSQPSDQQGDRSDAGSETGGAQESQPQTSEPQDPSQPDPQSEDGQQESGDAQQAGEAGSEQSPSDQQPGEAPEDGTQTGQAGENDDPSAANDAARQADGQNGQGGEQTGDGTDSSPSSDSPSPSAAGGTPDTDSSASPQPQPGGEATPQDSRQEPLHDGEAFERALEHFERTERSSPTPQTDDTGDAAPQSPRDQDPASRDDAGPTDPASDSRPGSLDQTGDRSPQSDPTAADQPAQSPTEPSGDAPQPKPSRSDSPDSATGPDDRPSPSESEGGEPKPDRVEGDQTTSGTDPKDPAGGDRSDDPSAPQPAPSTPGTEPTPSTGSDQPDPADTPDASPSSDPSAQSGQGPRSNGDPKQAGDPGSKAPPQPAAKPDGPSDSDSAADADASSSDTGPESSGPESSGPESSGPESSGPESDTGPDSSGSPGDQPAQSGDPMPSRPGEPAGEAEDSRRPQEPSPGDPSGGATGGVPQGDALPDESTTPPTDRPNELAEADPVNLEYARQATELVLERLKDQQSNPDPELLESLGWTADELDRFVARWESLKRAAQEDRARGRTDLDDALRSLGLRATGPERRGGGAQADRVPGLRDQSRSRPPAEFLEQFNAYKRGAARGMQDGGRESP